MVCIVKSFRKIQVNDNLFDVLVIVCIIFAEKNKQLGNCWVSFSEAVLPTAQFIVDFRVKKSNRIFSSINDNRGNMDMGL